MAPLRIRTLSFSTLVRTVIVLILVGAIAWYAFFQARFFIAGPQIELKSPSNAEVHERIVPVRGYATNITRLTLNGKVIHTNEDGLFEEELVAVPGYTIMTLHAEDRYGRVTTLSRPLVYEHIEL